MPFTVRSEPPLPDEAIVVRGGMMLPIDLERAADRSLATLGFPGLSVHAAAGMSFRELVLAAPALVGYRVVRRANVGVLRAGGFEFVPTGDAPHQTLRLPAVDFPTLARLRDLFGAPIPNPLRR